MQPYEIFYFGLRPFLPALQSKIYRDLKRLCTRYSHSARPRLLDVGGRKSPYTIGLRAEVTILDLPRTSELQNSLNLGLTNQIVSKLQDRRANIKNIVFDDMTQCRVLTDSQFDGVIFIEVLEHVLEDRAFLHNVARVLKPGGWCYLTTPNGDYIRNDPPNNNPDHVRHYTQVQLRDRLQEFFSEVHVGYAIRTGKCRMRGLRSYSLRRPLATALAIISNLINRMESVGVENQPKRTAHLFAWAFK